VQTTGVNLTGQIALQMSAALKNALDWGSTSGLWKGKTGALVGTGGGSGSARAQLAVRQAFVFLDLTLLNAPEIAIHRFTTPAFDEKTGDLTDPAWDERVNDLVKRLATLTRKLKQE
jgi:chromate reductase